MGTRTQYKGLWVVENATGQGGIDLTNDFQLLADRAPFTDIDDPTVNDDSDAGYEVGALWFNSTTNTMWVSVDSTNGSAVWRSLFKRTATNLALNPDADGAVAIDNLSFDGNTISSTNTDGDINLDSNGDITLDAAGDIYLDPESVPGKVVVQTLRPVTFYPTAGLEIQASVGGNEFLYGGRGSTGANWGGFGFGGTDNTLGKYWIGADSGTARLTIDNSTGNVGIGHTTPSNKLHVLGSVTIQDGSLVLDEVDPPATPPAGTAVLFLQSQSLKIKFANGTTKTLADNS